MPTVSRVREKR